MPVTLTWPVTQTFDGQTQTFGRHVSFLGKGLLSPLREDNTTGDFQVVSDEANVKQCLRDGILTAIGERVMLEPFGTITPTLLFEESDVVVDLLQPSISDYVQRFEPRVILQSAQVNMDSANPAMTSFNVSIVYVIRATNARRNLVFPFYLASTDRG